MKKYYYYENGIEETYNELELKRIFLAYTLEVRQHTNFEDWLEENIKMQILIPIMT